MILPNSSSVNKSLFLISALAIFLFLSVFIFAEKTFAAAAPFFYNVSPPANSTEIIPPTPCELPATCDNTAIPGEPNQCGGTCPTNVNGSKGNSWTKYALTCWKNPAGELTGIYQFDSLVCSIGDKCVAGETGLRAGSCTCGNYGASDYKYCCTTTGTAEACTTSGATQDPYAPDEGQCPGGYIVDGSRVRDSSCVPLVTCSTDTTNPPNPYTQCGQSGGCTNNYAANHTISITRNLCTDSTYTYSCLDQGIIPGQCGTPPAGGGLTLDSFAGAACFAAGYTASLSWTGSALPASDSGCPNGYWVDISTSSAFSSYSNKCVSSTSTISPSGFGGPAGSFTFQKGSTYYARVFNGSHSNTLSHSIPSNDCGGGGGACGEYINGALDRPIAGSTVPSPVTFSGRYWCQSGKCFDFTAQAANSWIGVDVGPNYQGGTQYKFSDGGSIGGGSFSKSIALSPGQHQVFVHVEGWANPSPGGNVWVDLSNIQSCGSENITVSPPADTQKPICSNLTLSAASGEAGAPVTITVSTSDNIEVESVDLFQDGNPNPFYTQSNYTHAKPAFNFSTNWTPTTAGTYRITATATDTSNNPSLLTTSCTKTYTAGVPVWVPTSCTSTDQFFGCRLQSSTTDCDDYGNLSYPNYSPEAQGKCQTVCGYSTQADRNRVACTTANGTITTTTPVSKTGSNWNPVTITTTTNNAGGSKVFIHSSTCTLGGTCNPSTGWTPISACDSSTDGTKTCTYNFPSSQPASTRTFGLFTPNNLTILATSNTVFGVCTENDTRPICNASVTVPGNVCTL